MRVGVIVFSMFCLATSRLAAQQSSNTSPQPLPASHYVNEELPRWLNLGGEFRMRVEDFRGGSFRSGNDDGYLLTRLRIHLGIRPAPWMNVFVQGQDSRAMWKQQNPPAPPFHSRMNLRQAYLEIGNTAKGKFGVRIGRQEMAFGEERLIGPSGWLNTPRYFEAARLTLRHAKVRADVFASSVIFVQNGTYSKAQRSNNLHGIYGGFDNIVPKSTIEPYLLWRLQRNQRTESGRVGNLDFKAAGVRWAGLVPNAVDYSVEVLNERGGIGTDHLQAWGAHLLLGHNFAGSNYKPRLFGEYNFASGDENPFDGRRGTFDSIYPTGHDRWGLADQIGWRNIHHLRLGVEATVLPKVVLKSGYHNYWLVSATDGLYAPGGALVTRLTSGVGGRRVGQEFDIQAVWSARPDMTINVGYADLIPGEFLKKATPGAGYHYPFLQVTYTF